MNIRILDALMRISYSGRDLTDDDADKIISAGRSVWFRRGNRRIELPDNFQ